MTFSHGVVAAGSGNRGLLTWTSLSAVTALLMTLGPLAEGRWSDCQRVLCRGGGSPFVLGRVLAALILERVPADQPVVIRVEDTNPQHKGNTVDGKGARPNEPGDCFLCSGPCRLCRIPRDLPAVRTACASPIEDG